MSGTGLRFTEVMTGHVAFGEPDHDRAAVAGREAGHRLTLRLTVEIDDLARFAADPNREARLRGLVDCDALGGTLPIERGAFNLLVASGEAGRRRMLYRLFLRDGVGHRLTLAGEKPVGAPGLRVWADTTTLYVRLLGGHVEPDDEAAAEIVASGIARLRPLAFVRQLTTFRAMGRSPAARLAAIARFDALFAWHLWRAYGPPTLRRAAQQRPPRAGGTRR